MNYFPQEEPCNYLGYRYNKSITSNVRYEKFIRGPLPLYWFEAMRNESGKTYADALLIWYKVSLINSYTIQISKPEKTMFSISDASFKHALDVLVKHNLISVEKRTGRPTKITLLEEDYRI